MHVCACVCMSVYVCLCVCMHVSRCVACLSFPQELIRVIDHDRKLKEFMSRKDQERTEAHMEIEEARRKKSKYR